MVGIIDGVMSQVHRFDLGFKSLEGPSAEKVNIFQIYLNDSNDQTLSPYLQMATGLIDQGYPNANHVIYNKETLRVFIAENFAADVLGAYDGLLPFSYKADLGRFCLLYKFGGWYFDISARLSVPINVKKNVEMLAFRDVQKHCLSSWGCATTVLYSKPGNPVLMTAIEQIVRNVAEKYYGITAVCPTGPNVLGAALALHRTNRHNVFGDAVDLTSEQKIKNRAFVLPDGNIFAFSKPHSAANFKKLAKRGVNDYKMMWIKRKIYA